MATESTKLLDFMGRRFGGIELEIFLCLAEWGCGLLIFFFPVSVWNSIPLSQFYGTDTNLVSLTFIFSALCTTIGLIMFARRKRVCAPLRFIGSLSSWAIWSALSAQTIQLAGFDLIHLVFYILSAMASIRTAAGAWGRWLEPPVGFA